MDMHALKTLIAKGESETLEFKKSMGLLKGIFQTLTAFLNNIGGVVLVGVLDDGTIVGQHITDSTRQKLAKALVKIEPPAQIQTDYVSVGDKQVIVLTVLPGKHAPYVYDGRAYQREMTSTSRMLQHRYEQQLVARGQLDYSWERSLSDRYGLDDLDHDGIYKAVMDGVRAHRVPAGAIKESIEEVLLRFQLLEGKRIRNAALALFAKDHVYLSQCRIKMARFQGRDMLGDFIDNQLVHGNVFKLLEVADAFLRRHLPISSTFRQDQFARIDTPALPVMAVREALINALCHRNYVDHQTDFTLAIFDDRLELWNSGLLPHEITFESLKGPHPSILRNELIAGVFYIRDYIEQWGTGTNKIITQCRESGLEDPVFSEMSGGIMVTFYFKEPMGGSISCRESDQVILNERQKDILSVIRGKGIIGIRDLLYELQNPPSRRMVQKELGLLRQLNLISIIGSGRGALWSLRKN